MSLVEIGIVTRPHGVRGLLRVMLHDRESDSLVGARRIVLGAREYDLRAARKTPDAYLLEVAGIADRDAAEALRGAPVAMRREDIPTTDDEILLADLIGCSVQLRDGSSYGEIEDVQAGFQDLLVIGDGEVERLLPLVDAFVIDIDLEARRVTVDPPEELPETRRER
jgi:16S rRNA processing protein RimM